MTATIQALEVRSISMDSKPTLLKYRPNAKFPWLIKQGHNEVKLTDDQKKLLAELLGAIQP